MPKEKCSSRYLKIWWVSGNSDYSTDSVVVYCQVCAKEVKCEKKFQLEQHSMNAHITTKGKKNSTPQQLLLTQVNLKSSVNTFSADLCKALECSNIPWNKLSSPVL
ncbi:hypothetical protein B7P43_G00801 [Cryptotermes secundus]|uniref:Uncharacterized protein n=1 Tax=Cryptotermes secundus TaxID=105785 RepID=A0A2J7QSF6_9NEOP|nr:hypothetical protein B7P43_G00801 [Cryptotermes secundus]